MKIMYLIITDNIGRGIGKKNQKIQECVYQIMDQCNLILQGNKECCYPSSKKQWCPILGSRKLDRYVSHCSSVIRGLIPGTANFPPPGAAWILEEIQIKALGYPWDQIQQGCKTMTLHLSFISNSPCYMDHRFCTAFQDIIS